MYNPYNWHIESEHGYIYSSFDKYKWETEEEYQDRLYNEIAKWTAIRNTNILKINMAKMNLDDSISLLSTVDNDCEIIKHDIVYLQRMVDEYQFSCKVLKELEEYLM